MKTAGGKYISFKKHMPYLSTILRTVSGKKVGIYFSLLYSITHKKWQLSPSPRHTTQPSHCLWPQPNHCLIIQTEELLSRLLCFQFVVILLQMFTLFYLELNKQYLLFNLLPKAIRVEQLPTVSTYCLSLAQIPTESYGTNWYLSVCVQY